MPIKHVQSKIAKNLGILKKFRYYTDLKILKQLYYTLIYPYLNYGLMSWGNIYPTVLNKLRSCQNTCIKSIFFAHMRENATPYHGRTGRKKIGGRKEICPSFSHFARVVKKNFPEKLPKIVVNGDVVTKNSY
jgi:hypothetical protein